MLDSKKEEDYAGLLCQVSRQEGNEERQGYHHEERQAGDSGRVPDLLYQDVPYWQGLVPD